VEFGYAWLIIPLAAAFGLGWLASRFDRWQTGREPKEAPHAYFKGLTFLLNEQQDKAIDSFVEAVKLDPQTVELQFALGNLFRRRGEYERSVRVHQSLAERSDIKAVERERAQLELANDYFKAGLLDRAEQSYATLANSRYAAEALQAQLQIAERSKDWPHAIEVAQALQTRGIGSYGRWVAQYWCELAELRDSKDERDGASEALTQALKANDACVRARLLAGDWLARDGHVADAVRIARLLKSTPSESISSIDSVALKQRVQQWIEAQPGIDTLDARLALAGNDAERQQVAEQFLARQKTLSAARKVLDFHTDFGAMQAPLLGAIDKALASGQRYRCAACGFEARHYFWQCPGCLGWETYPPARQEEL
jgi:lipopolysaccharide assembly protein B